MHYNVQSIVNKIRLLEPELCYVRITCLTETWLNESISDAEIEFEGFTTYRRNRGGGSHGGICVYMFIGKINIPKGEQTLNFIALNAYGLKYQFNTGNC